MKKIVLLLLLSVVTLCNAQLTGKIVKVKDGDTVVILDSSNTMTTIRLAGVDCPEKRQDFGVAAKQFTSDLIFGKDVVVNIISKDKYGRSISWIYVSGVNVSEELLKAGLAWHYKEYDKSKTLQSLEDTARTNKTGLWSKPNPVYPSLFRAKK